MSINFKTYNGFEVWVRQLDANHVYRMQCMSTFLYWQECLDYKDYCHKKGVDCYIRTLQPSKTWRTEYRPVTRETK
jgi:hypothetical protein